MENKEEILSSDKKKMKKLLLKNTKIVEKKALYLKKMKLASPFLKIWIYFRYQIINLLLSSALFIVIIGFVGGAICRAIWGIWLWIFGLHL